MSVTRRAQILMEPDEYDCLEAIARQKGVAVAELIRRAVRERYLLARDDRLRVAGEICSMDLQVGDWQELEEEIALGHVADLP